MPWEQSEGFLFGPVSAQGWDPAMDSWPLNRDDLEAVLASDEVLDLEFVTNLPETQKGFHTIEYLLWGEDSLKTADQFDDRELEYLLALSEELVLITSDLATSWTEGVGGQAAYREVFTTAGEDGNTAYPSLSSAAQEILVGMSGICDEVANGKIADPYDARDPNLVESQYSFNSLFDFQDNMRSVLNAYTGDMPDGRDRRATGSTTGSRSATRMLDERFQAEIDAAIAALEAIPPPFRDAITDPANDEAIEAAQQAIRPCRPPLTATCRISSCNKRPTVRRSEPRCLSRAAVTAAALALLPLGCGGGDESARLPGRRRHHRRGPDVQRVQLPRAQPR